MLRMSRHYDPHRDCVYYADALLPADAFYTQDPIETRLVSLAFEVSRSVASLKLTETELALYSAVVLLSPGQFHFAILINVIVYTLYKNRSKLDNNDVIRIVIIISNFES